MRYLLWDWNGTLLDDTDAAIAALNVLLRRRGLREIDRAFYLENFSFPVRPFYERLGMALDREDWDALAREYHAAYAAEPKRLNAEAFSALDLARSAGARQAIISALRQDLLDRATAETGVAPYMAFVYGVDNLDGASKLDRARELLVRIAVRERGRERPEVVMIGDALHDKEVADELGVGCVLCAQGGHSATRLRAAAPTGETLLEAVRMALDLTPRPTDENLV